MRSALTYSAKLTISAIFLLIVSAVNISAATFTVSNTNNTGAGSLRQAVLDSNAAAGSDTIVFDSSFNSPQTITLTSVITINPATGDSLTITGPGANLLTVSGNNATQILALSSGDTASISGMTLTQAVTGAISNGGTLTVTNSTFNANTNNGGFNEGGGAISTRSGLSLTVIGCSFTNNTNTAPGVNGTGGGAISNDAIATIINSTFTNNSAVNGAAGGAIYTRDGMMSITGSTFTGNTTTSTGQNSQGGAVAVQGNGQLTINNSVLTGNSTTKDGGAIYYQPNGGTPFLTITDSTISNNIANSDADDFGNGGGLSLQGTGSVSISGTTINGNTARQSSSFSAFAGNGGGIAASAITNLTNTTVSGNTAGFTGGGIYTIGTSTIIVTIESSTITGNTATSSGGGLIANSSNPVNIHNSIFANNTDNGTAPDIRSGTVVSQGYNLIRNTTGATISGTTTGNITGVDPRIDGVLRNNGGLTKTHALRRTSPALNAGDPASFPATDQRGFPRPGTGSKISDIGAYERQSNDLVVPAAFDFEDDGRADLSVFRANSDPAFADFQIRKSSDNLLLGYSWGLPGDKLAPADYDGDGKTDVAVWREAEGNFYILNSANGTLRQENFGLTGDILSVGDWDGDTKADLAVYRAGAQSFFYYRGSLNNPSGSVTSIAWGISGDLPQRGDFDGDSKADAAVFRPSNNVWYILQSSNTSVRYDYWGISTDKFVSADYDGDAKTDLAVFRNGVWYIKQSSNNQPRYEYFGLSTDTLVPADYDGEGKADVAVFRNGVWYIKQSMNGNVSIANFGLGGDAAVPGAYIINP
ncbi:MAG: choice-of-anchor Q domain-containing protein [Pyrinomonadaceae bacterium]